MPEPETVQQYLETVAAQICWKRARPAVIAELARHLEDQREAYAAASYDNAEQLAVEEMGDPVSVGVELNRIHRPKPQYGSLVLAVLLALSGMAARIFLPAEQISDGDLFKIVTSFALGCAALFAGYFFNGTCLQHHGRAIYFAVLAVSCAVLVPSLDRYGLLPFEIRYLSLFYPVAYALWLGTCRQKGWAGLMVAAAGMVPLVCLCLLSHYTFSLFLLGVTGCVLLMSSIWHDHFGVGRWRPLLIAAIVILAGGGLAGRVLFSGFSSPAAQYQRAAMERALEHAKWLGTSAWNGASGTNPSLWAIPNCDSDAFLTSLIVQMGWLPCLVFILVFFGLTARLLYLCLRHKSPFGKAVALAATIALMTQALCNLAFQLNGLPLSAVFPLLVGNGFTVVNLGLIGLALSVFRQEQLLQDSV